jgi:hypothetical protein
MTAFTPTGCSAVRLGILLLLLGNFAWARSHDELCVDALPDDAAASLKSQFPTFYPEKVSDLSPEYQEVWLKDHPHECPGIAVGHFQSPSKVSYAVLLIGSRGSLSGSKLVVLSQSAGGWKATKLTEETVAYHYEAVSNVTQGKLRRSSASLDRIRFKEFDGGATVYSWSGGRFHKVTVKE